MCYKWHLSCLNTALQKSHFHTLKLSDYQILALLYCPESLHVLLEVYRNKAVQVSFECGIISYISKHQTGISWDQNCTKKWRKLREDNKSKVVFLVVCFSLKITRTSALKTLLPLFQKGAAFICFSLSTAVKQDRCTTVSALWPSEWKTSPESPTH